SANKYDGRKEDDNEENRCSCTRRWKIKVERAKCPYCTNERNQPRERPAYEFHHAHAKYGLTAVSLMRYSVDTASAGHVSSVAFPLLSGLKRSRLSNVFSVSRPKSF